MSTIREHVPHKPRPVPQVMVSSTFTDLAEHRAALINAIHTYGLHANVMEFDSARLVDVIDSSLEMVRESAAYIGVIGLKYGQTPECSRRNPDRRSITELEFDEALRLGRPILLYIMGDGHLVMKADIERDPDSERKLNAFRERAKQFAPGSTVNRVYAVFNSFDEFKKKLGSSLAELKTHLESDIDDAPEELPAGARDATIPRPPSFYAAPDYIGSHRFVGRAAELQLLTDWAAPADPTNLLLFEAIGGNGKSMLTWEWTKNHALSARPNESPWAGRFWYSFYEGGATMADFCQRALAYMTSRPLEHYAKKKTAELKDELVAQLRSRPWLLILDGLERVLVAYHRIDAAEVPDEEANAPIDKIASRNPCDAIRDEDNDLLRALAAPSASKVLVSSRLTPRVLLNPSNQPIPGARRITLPGLRPPDAEALLRSCGIEGTSAAMQSYLATNCDNHPLVIGILGGLITNYLPARGDFDTWSTAADGGGALDLASLDLIQRRNHILRAALDDLPADSRQLLSTLALLTDAVDYETLKALSPHQPSPPEGVAKPKPPEEAWGLIWDTLSDEDKAWYHRRYEADLTRRQEYEIAMQAHRAAESLAAPKLQATVKDLEQRGLLQWDGRERKYDLHPVVRGVASGGMASADHQRHGQRVVDHFSSQPHRPYNEVETMEDVQSGMHVVRTLIRMGRYQDAAREYRTGLDRPLYERLDAHNEVLLLLRPLFAGDWAAIPKHIAPSDAAFIAHSAGNALEAIGQRDQAAHAYESSLQVDLRLRDWLSTCTSMIAFAQSHSSVAIGERVLRLAIALAEGADLPSESVAGRIALYHGLAHVGRWSEADDVRKALDAISIARAGHPAGYIELIFTHVSHLRGQPNWEYWSTIERIITSSRSSLILRYFHMSLGRWRLEQGQWALAAASLQEAVRLARGRGFTDENSETGLALAKYRLGQLDSPRDEAERLAQLRKPAHLTLAGLWLALGDAERAKHHALVAYRWAWADGEPYVHRYELDRAAELLRQLDTPIPDLPPYDPDKDKPFPWEADVRAAIRTLTAEKHGRSAPDGSSKSVKRRNGLPPRE